METTGFPDRSGLPNATEVALIAVPRNSLTKASHDKTRPRIQDKLVLCLTPSRLISRRAMQLTGLTKGRLQRYGRDPPDDVFLLSLRCFLLRQTPPICFVAHNGNNFDYRILQQEIDSIAEKNISIGKIHTSTVDSLYFFRRYSPYSKNSLGHLSREYFGDSTQYAADNDATVLVRLIALPEYTRNFLNWAQRTKKEFVV
ncbi:three-prime repair exonuclease 1-like isoform X2 [Glandiceps talaboti]